MSELATGQVDTVSDKNASIFANNDDSGQVFVKDIRENYSFQVANIF